MRKLKYSDAVAEATAQMMEENQRMLVIGEGATDPKGIFGTTLLPFNQFGKSRVYDSPLSELAITGIVIGAAIEGTPMVMVHQRCEFLLLAADQVINHAAKWSYMCGGGVSVPIVIRAVIGRGWGQAAQHSQSFHAMFSHIPGLKVILPSNAYDAKGMLISAIRDKNPVICLEHRWLHGKECEVPQEPYSVQLGKAAIVAPGKDITCVAFSLHVHEALEAREKLLAEGIEIEVIDPRCVRPLDRETIAKSIQKTGRLMVIDMAPKQAGMSAEIAAIAAEDAQPFLKAPVQRITHLDVPTPCSHVLEQVFYPKIDDVIEAARHMMRGSRAKRNSKVDDRPEQVPFTGPF